MYKESKKVHAFIIINLKVNCVLPRLHGYTCTVGKSSGFQYIENFHAIERVSLYVELLICM